MAGPTAELGNSGWAGLPFLGMDEALQALLAGAPALLMRMVGGPTLQLVYSLAGCTARTDFPQMLRRYQLEALLPTRSLDGDVCMGITAELLRIGCGFNIQILDDVSQKLPA